MKKFNLIVLAGSDKGVLYDAYGCDIKALLPIHGRPMLDWVVDAFKNSGRIENAVIVGPAQLENCKSISFFRKRVFEGVHLLQNLAHAISYVKFRIYDQRQDHDGYLISFCDAVFLTPEIIQDTLDRIAQTDADIVLHYVEKQSIVKHNMPTNRTFIELAGKFYTGTTIYYVKRFSPILGQLEKLYKMRASRKNPRGLLDLLDCSEESIGAIENALSEKLGLSLKIMI